MKVDDALPISKLKEATAKAMEGEKFETGDEACAVIPRRRHVHPRHGPTLPQVYDEALKHYGKRLSDPGGVLDFDEFKTCAWRAHMAASGQ